jgi:hypothetical protein
MLKTLFKYFSEKGHIMDKREYFAQPDKPFTHDDLGKSYSKVIAAFHAEYPNGLKVEKKVSDEKDI